MAFIQQQGPNSASGRILTGTQQSSAPAGVSVPQALGGQAATSKAAQPPRFEGIRKYLEANKPQVEKLGEKVAGQVTGQAQAVREGIQQSQQNLGQLQQMSQNLQRARTPVQQQAQAPVQAQAQPDQIVTTMPVMMPGDTPKPVMGEPAGKTSIAPQEPEFAPSPYLQPVDQRAFGQEGFLQSAIGRVGELDPAQLTQLSSILGGNIGRDLLSKDFTAGLAQRGQALEDIKRQVGSEAGRTNLLRKALNPAQYSSGEAALDSALFNMAAPNIRKAQQAASAESQAYKQALSGLSKQQAVGREDLLRNIEETRSAAKTGLESADAQMKARLEGQASKQRQSAESQAQAARDVLSSYRPMTDADKNTLRTAGYGDSDIEQINSLRQGYIFDQQKLARKKLTDLALGVDSLNPQVQRDYKNQLTTLNAMSDQQLRDELNKLWTYNQGPATSEGAPTLISTLGNLTTSPLSRGFRMPEQQRADTIAMLSGQVPTAQEAQDFSRQRYDQVFRPFLGQEGISDISNIEGPSFGDIDVGSVASAQDYAKYGQLSQLLGRQPEMLLQGNAQRAGTAQNIASQQQQSYNESVMRNIAALNEAARRRNPAAASSSSGGVDWGQVALQGALGGPLGLFSGLSGLFR